MERSTATKWSTGWLAISILAHLVINYIIWAVKEGHGATAPESIMQIVSFMCERLRMQPPELYDPIAKALKGETLSKFEGPKFWLPDRRSSIIVLRSTTKRQLTTVHRSQHFEPHSKKLQIVKGVPTPNRSRQLSHGIPAEQPWSIWQPSLVDLHCISNYKRGPKLAIWQRNAPYLANRSQST